MTSAQDDSQDQPPPDTQYTVAINVTPATPFGSCGPVQCCLRPSLASPCHSLGPRAFVTVCHAGPFLTHWPGHNYWRREPRQALPPCQFFLFVESVWDHLADVAGREGCSTMHVCVFLHEL